MGGGLIDPPVALMICGDAGGAAAVAPVAQLLAREGRLAPRVLGTRVSRSAFDGRGIDLEPITRQPDVASARTVLRSSSAVVVITGTSVGELEPEKPFIAAARREGVPSIAVVDHWSNHRRRFADQGGRLRYVPDRIAVIDERALAESVDAGIPRERLVVTGAPQMDDLAELRSSFGRVQRTSLRASLPAGPDDLVVLLAPGPLAPAGGGRSDELEIAQLVTGALGEIARRRAVHIVVAVRPHPRDRGHIPELARTDDLGIASAAAGDGRRWALASDLVVGTRTMLLLEACYLDRIAISVQPGLVGLDTLPTNESGLSIPVYDLSQMKVMLERALFDDAFRRERHHRLDLARPEPGSARRVAELVYSLAASPSRR